MNTSSTDSYFILNQQICLHICLFLIYFSFLNNTTFSILAHKKLSNLCDSVCYYRLLLQCEVNLKIMFNSKIFQDMMIGSHLEQKASCYKPVVSDCVCVCRTNANCATILVRYNYQMHDNIIVHVFACEEICVCVCVCSCT